MATEVKVPSMGESITSGIISAWLVKEGDFVQKEQPIYELETDKITSEATAEVAGIITFKVSQDDEVDIGSIVATIDETAENPQSSSAQNNVQETSDHQEVSLAQASTADDNDKQDKDQDAAIDIDTSADADSSSTIKVSPLAKKIATSKGIDLNSIKGSGSQGKIVKSDLEDFLSKPKSAESPSSSSAQAQAQAQATQTTPEIPSKGTLRETRVKMSPLRRKIAQRLVMATQEAALLTTFNEVDMTRIMELRKAHQASFVEKYGIKLGFMSFFTKAATLALKAVPNVNARIEGDTIVQQHYYDIGVAVGTEKGLMVPVLRDCDEKSFSDIELSIANYAKDAREGKIKFNDLEGGVFTISNGGIYGSMLSTPIINFPQPAILGLHNIQQRAVVIDGQVVARPMMYLALSYDHRLIDGKEAVTFLSHIKGSIENPDRILLDL